MTSIFFSELWLLIKAASLCNDQSYARKIIDINLTAWLFNCGHRFNRHNPFHYLLPSRPNFSPYLLPFMSNLPLYLLSSGPNLSSTIFLLNRTNLNFSHRYPIGVICIHVSVSFFFISLLLKLSIVIFLCSFFQLAETRQKEHLFETISDPKMVLKWILLLPLFLQAKLFTGCPSFSRTSTQTDLQLYFIDFINFNIMNINIFMFYGSIWPKKINLFILFGR